MPDKKIVLITERLPTAADADQRGDVLWLRSQHWWCLGRWHKVPVDATAWQGC
jgi:hypothetical protein